MRSVFVVIVVLGYLGSVFCFYMAGRTYEAEAYVPEHYALRLMRGKDLLHRVDKDQAWVNNRAAEGYELTHVVRCYDNGVLVIMKRSR